MEDIQKEVELLRNKVLDYEYKPPETDYTKQLKAFLDNPPAAHKISLKNGSIIEGTIKKDKLDRKSTRLNSSHKPISYAVFCLKKKNHTPLHPQHIHPSSKYTFIVVCL